MGNVGDIDPYGLSFNFLIKYKRLCFFDQKCVIKDLDLRGDWFHKIMHILHNIHIWNYVVGKL